MASGSDTEMGAGASEPLTPEQLAAQLAQQIEQRQLQAQQQRQAQPTPQTPSWGVPGGTSSGGPSATAMSQFTAEQLEALARKELQEREKKQAEARIATLRAELEALEQAHGQVSKSVGAPAPASVSAPVSAPVHGLVSGSNAQAATTEDLRAMRPPAPWVGDCNGARKASTFLQEIADYAAACGARKEVVLPSYMGHEVRELWEQQRAAWGDKQVTWPDMCTAFKRIVGQAEEQHMQGRVLDALLTGQVKQQAHQNLASYKVMFENKLMQSAPVTPQTAVRLFVNGLGCKKLQAECQPGLDANEYADVESVYVFARGAERKLQSLGTKPYEQLRAQAAAVGTKRGREGQVELCHDCHMPQDDPAEGCRNRWHNYAANKRGGSKGWRGNGGGYGRGGGRGGASGSGRGFGNGGGNGGYEGPRRNGYYGGANGKHQGQRGGRYGGRGWGGMRQYGHAAPVQTPQAEAQAVMPMV